MVLYLKTLKQKHPQNQNKITTICNKKPDKKKKRKESNLKIMGIIYTQKLNWVYIHNSIFTFSICSWKWAATSRPISEQALVHAVFNNGSWT